MINEAADPRPAAVEAAVAHIRSRISLRPEIGIVLGSGLSGVVEAAEGVSIPYSEIPEFGLPTAPGHRGELVVGRLRGRPVAIMRGRFHLYEGHPVDRVVLPVRVLRQLGVEHLVVTNAAGGCDPSWPPGTLMLISDHINHTGHNPLVGPNLPAWGPRFPDLSRAYDPELRRLARRVAEAQGVTLTEGVYMGFLGPNYETPAEVRMARLLGAAAVGMSTVLEVIAAVHCGLRVLGLSCITNHAAGITDRPITEAEVLETTARVGGTMSGLLAGVVEAIGAASEPTTLEPAPAS